MNTDYIDGEVPEDDTEFAQANPVIKRIIEESLANQPQVPLRSDFENLRPEPSDMEKRVAYTKFKESSNRPEQVNASNPNKPTTGYFHIEQPTYVENMRSKYGDHEANKIAKLTPNQYIKYIQSHADEEEEMGKRIIAEKTEKFGDKPIRDHLGRINPAWRVAYTMGDTGFKRFIRNTKQDN
jgi:hypothetical protein